MSLRFSFGSITLDGEGDSPAVVSADLLLAHANNKYLVREIFWKQ